MLFLCVPVLSGAATAAQEPAPPTFAAHTAEGATVTGPLERVGGDWAIQFGGTKPALVKGSDLVTLRRGQAPLPAPPADEQVILANGDRIPGTIGALTGERLRMSPQIGSGQELTLPLTAVAVVWLAPPDGTSDAAALRRRLALQWRRRDRVLLRNGDIAEGMVASLSDKICRIQAAGGKKLQLDRDKIAVIALNSALSRVPRPRGPYAALVLSNGCRLSLASAVGNAQTLTGKAVFGASVTVPVEQLAALDMRQGCAVYLSDLKPSRYEHTPFLSVHWPYVADGSVAGNDLRLAGSTYDKGLGMHSESRISYDLGGGFRWFESLVGLDERTGRQGSVVIDVLVDGKLQSGATVELTGQDAPRSLRVSVAGARLLTLVVKFGAGADVQDHVDWADALLIR